MKNIQPKYLQAGDQVALVGLASKAKLEDLTFAIKTIENWGLKITIGESVTASFNDFSGSDELRQKDFQNQLDNPEIKAIFSIRGGYGSSKIIDNIDFTQFIFHPKWIIGFSDITAVHLAVNSLEIQSVHGPMPKTFAYDFESNECLRKILFGEDSYFSFETNFPNIIGSGKGKAIGGNLCILAHNIGSKYDVSFDQKILFLEDVSEYLYNIDRMMVQLKRARKLDNLAGLVVGSFTDIKENDANFGKNIQEIIIEHTSAFNYPVAFGFDFGHDHKNYAIKLGEYYHLETKSYNSILTNSKNLI